jgi:hypothetical protein
MVLRMIPKVVKRKLRVSASAAFLVVAALLGGATASLAQDEAKVKAGLTAWKTAGCPDCHGSFADGDKQRDEAPTGANLRTARMSDAELAETIRCGRASTGMPRFDEGAYVQRGCYGQPTGAVPDALYPTPRMLSADEIDALVVYLRARVIGRRAITPEECAYYYEESASTSCDPAK